MSREWSALNRSVVAIRFSSPLFRREYSLDVRGCQKSSTIAPSTRKRTPELQNQSKTQRYTQSKQQNRR
jgi:hypothetical protein